MKIITHEDILNLEISPNLCLEWVDKMIKNKINTQLPPKISLRPYEGNFCNVMPAILAGIEF